MEFSRRNFLKTAGIAGAAIAASGSLTTIFGQRRKSGDLYAIPGESYNDPLFFKSKADFEGMIGSRFTVSGTGGRPIELTLSAIVDHERKSNAARGFYGESYSLIFDLPRGIRNFQQDVYELRSAQFGASNVLLVPVGLEKRQIELVINHVQPS